MTKIYKIGLKNWPVADEMFEQAWRTAPDAQARISGSELNEYCTEEDGSLSNTVVSQARNFLPQHLVSHSPSGDSSTKHTDAQSVIHHPDECQQPDQEVSHGTTRKRKDRKGPKSDGWWERNPYDFELVIRIIGPYLGHKTDCKGHDLTRRMLRNKLNTYYAERILTHKEDVKALQEMAKVLGPAYRQVTERRIYALRKELKDKHHTPWDTSYYLFKNAREKEGMEGAPLDQLKDHVLRKWRPNRGTLDRQRQNDAKREMSASSSSQIH